MRSRIRSLEDQLAEERDARRRKADTIIAQLTQANAALAARVPELEASSEPPGGPTEPRRARSGHTVPEHRGRSGGHTEALMEEAVRRLECRYLSSVPASGTGRHRSP